MHRRLKPFPLLPFGVYPHCARALSLSPINPRFPHTLMAVFARQDVLHSLWFSSSPSWKEHGSMSSSSTRKKETPYCQGRIAQHLNISTFCSLKHIQHSNLDNGAVQLQHESPIVNYASYQGSQCSSFGNFDGRNIANEIIEYNSPRDRAQVTSPAKTDDEAWGAEGYEFKQLNTYAVKKALPVEEATPVVIGEEDSKSNRLERSNSSRIASSKAWAAKGDEIKQCKTYAVKKALPVEATPVLIGEEDSKSNRLKGSNSYLPTSSSNRLSQQLECKTIGEKTEETHITDKEAVSIEELKEKLVKIYDKVLIVDDVTTAKQVVLLLTTKYKNLIHACDTEVSGINVKQETPVDHGEIICFSIYSGPQADFGNGKNYIWVDVLDGGQGVLNEFSPFFEDPTIKKVWHNYSFDVHIIENFRIQVSGFHADTMHLARLWDSSRKIDGGYSLEALTGDEIVMSGTGAHSVDEFMGKISMKTIFGKKKLKKDGKAGKSITMAPVELLQREEPILWICYSVLDSISTLRLYESLKAKLEGMVWNFNGVHRGTMYNFYEEYWRPFGSLLTKMEAEGLLVDRAYLSDVEKIAIAEQQAAADKFRSWASKYCPDAEYMNVGSDCQIRQLFFGGTSNRKNKEQKLPLSKTFKVPNVENFTEDEKKPSKYRNITLHSFGKEMNAEMYTASGWPSMSGDVLKTIAGKISPDCIYPVHDGAEQETEQSSSLHEPSEVNRVLKDISIYGTAYNTFGEGKEGKEACHAIAALCEVCSIDSLISNFILPLQGTHISGKDGRIHCSLNINTETGRLSARRPNLQNQPALEKDRYKIRKAFIAGPEKSLIVADYGQLELRILAHLANCKSMLDAFKAGGDFHSRTAMNMYSHVREAVEKRKVLLEWYPQTAEEKPPVPLLKDAFAAERRKAKSLNFSIAYGKTPQGLSRDWKVPLKEAKETVELWYKDRLDVLKWQEKQKENVNKKQCVDTLLGRKRRFPSLVNASYAFKGHIERAAINTPVQGSAADVAMCAMLEINRNARLKELGWKLLLQVHDEVILEGPTESAEIAKAIVIECMSKPFNGKNILNVDLSVDAKVAQNWYAAK